MLPRSMSGKSFGPLLHEDIGELEAAMAIDKAASRRKDAAEEDDRQSALVELAARIEPDGGMPGKTEEERVLRSILAVLQFLAGGHSPRSGAFRKHVERLVKFLEAAELQNDIVREVVRRAREGNPVPGDWSKRTLDSSLWGEIDRALQSR
jgi:hypothetical protein